MKNTITISGTCEHCGKKFNYDDCIDISGMLGGETPEYKCCRECAESKTANQAKTTDESNR